MAASTVESVAEIVCESGEDSNTCENDSEAEALVNGAERIDGTEREGDKQTKLSGETSTEILLEYKYLFSKLKL